MIDLAVIKHVLFADGVICYPTEAVWGLGCHPKSEVGFKKILALKNRQQDKGVILIASNYQQIMPYVVLDDGLEKQLQTIWPGFITCLLPKSDSCPDYLSGGFDRVAVRLTTHPTVKCLCNSIGSPLVSTSANISGLPPVQTIAEAKQTFSHDVDYYVDAALGGEEKPSRIIQLTTQAPIIIRE